MGTLAAHSSALMILNKVLNESDVDGGNIHLYYTTRGVGRNDVNEEIKTEVYFFGVGPDIYVVNLYDDGGEVQHLKSADTWSVFPQTEDEDERNDVVSED